MIIHILDKYGRPIGAMREELVHEQNLLHRRLILFLYVKEMICLKKSQKENYRYDFLVNMHISFDSSQEELIEKELEKLDISKTFLKPLIQDIFYKEKNELISIYFIEKNGLEIEVLDLDVIYLKKGEFDFSLKKYPDIFSDYVHWTHSMELTFLGFFNI